MGGRGVSVCTGAVFSAISAEQAVLDCAHEHSYKGLLSFKLEYICHSSPQVIYTLVALWLLQPMSQQGLTALHDPVLLSFFLG